MAETFYAEQAAALRDAQVVPRAARALPSMLARKRAEMTRALERLEGLSKLRRPTSRSPTMKVELSELQPVLEAKSSRRPAADRGAA